MLTPGVSPTSAVRARWASVAVQSIPPSAVWGSSTADIPVISRRGRILDAMSSAIEENLAMRGAVGFVSPLASALDSPR